MPIKPKAGYHFLFFAFLIAISWYYQYQDILFYRPMSVHSWRQTDCASIALNYYQRNMNFFHPEVCHNLYDNHGYAVSEFPWLYYITAILYKVFGFHEWLYRGLVTAFFFGGLYALFLLSYLVLKDVFFSMIVPLFLFTCPIPVYYANNFLPNVPALSLEIGSIYFFARYYFDRRLKFFILALLFFLFTGLTKMSSLLSFTAILGLFGMQVIGLSHWYSKDEIFKHVLAAWIGFPAVLVLFFIWYWWAAKYNELHHTTLFLIGILPAWDMPKDQINATIDKLHYYYINYLFYRSLVWLFCAMPVIILLNAKKIDRIWLWILLFMGFGAIVYCIFFFQTFYVHDYYFICLYSFLVMLLLIFFLVLRHRFPDFFKSVELRVLMVFSLWLSVNHCADVLHSQYYGWQKDDGANSALYDPQFIAQLRSKGIAPLTTVLVDADLTPNKTLYLLNLRGWSQYLWNPPYTVSIEEFCKMGIKYVIVDDKDCMQKERYNYIKDHLLFDYHGIFVFGVP